MQWVRFKSLEKDWLRKRRQRKIQGQRDKSLLMIDIELIKKEYNLLLKELGNPELISNWEKFEELSRRREIL